MGGELGVLYKKIKKNSSFKGNITPIFLQSALSSKENLRNRKPVIFYMFPSFSCFNDSPKIELMKSSWIKPETIKLLISKSHNMNLIYWRRDFMRFFKIIIFLYFVGVIASKTCLSPPPKKNQKISKPLSRLKYRHCD